MHELRQLAAGEIADQPMRWPVVGHRVLGRGAVSEFVDDEVRTPSGETMHRQYLLHPGAVGVIAWDDADRIAVVRQYRHPAGFRLTEPPAGLLDHANEESLRIFLARDLSAAPAPDGFVADHEEADMEVCWAARSDLVDAIFAGHLQNPTMVAGVLALETARLAGRLDELRPPSAPWQAREAWQARRAELAAIGDVDRA